MTQTTDAPSLSPLACGAGDDPIEDRLRANVRATIEAVFEEELAAFLGRLRYDRGDGARKGSARCGLCDRHSVNRDHLPLSAETSPPVSVATSCSLRYTQAFRAVLQRDAMRFSARGQMRLVDDPSALVRRDPERSTIPIRGIIWGIGLDRFV